MDEQLMKNCRICPRECGVDRTAGNRGRCGAPAQVILARAALHFWEEPCISGSAGSGAVFFSGCSLGCIYCQNVEISGLTIPKGATKQELTESLEPVKEQTATGLEAATEQHPVGTEAATEQKCADSPEAVKKQMSILPGISARKLPGIEVSIEELAQIFLRLQNEEGANNINLVTAAHYLPQTAKALAIAKSKGLSIPVIYNSGGYEKVSSLRMLDGLVDVYLPDFKYMSSGTAGDYSNAQDYPEIAKAAIAEMVRQAGSVSIDPATALIRKGVIVRHLLLPGHVQEAKEIIFYLHDKYGDSIGLSIMNQYTPMQQMKSHPLLNRRTTRREYERLIDYAIGIGVTYGYIQEGGTAKESFIPSWNGEGVRQAIHNS